MIVILAHKFDKPVFDSMSYCQVLNCLSFVKLHHLSIESNCRACKLPFDWIEATNKVLWFYIMYYLMTNYVK